MKVSDYIIQRLAEEGITHAFLVQGGAMNDLLYSIADHPTMEYVCAGHEQCAGFMAEGYTKARDDGTPGLAIATSGPGAQNLLTAIANCYYDSVPVIFLTGQVKTTFLRPSRALRQVGFQECDIVAMARPVTKYSVMIRHANDIRYELEYALWFCRDGRPGPVLLDLPVDVQQAEIDPEALAKFGPPSFRQKIINLGDAFSTGIDQFLDDLARAERPALLIGGGVRGKRAVETFNLLAEALRVPCFPTWNALDVVPSDHPWYGGRIGTYGGAGRNFGIQNCDLLLAIGCRLSGRITGGAPTTFARGAKRYAVDIDEALLDPCTQQQPFHVNIHADATEFMRELEAAHRRNMINKEWADGHDAALTIWWNTVQAWRDKYDPVRPEHGEGHPYRFVRELSHLLPADAVIMTDCGGNVVTMNHAFETKTGQRYFSSNGNSPMGFAIAGAIGAWHADPSRPVICVIGDGGLSINAQELAALRRTTVKVFVLNNHCYGITRAFQETHNAGRAEASSPATGVWLPSVDALARAYGIQSFSSSRRHRLQSTLSYPGPFIYDVDIGDFHDYAPRIFGWGTPIEDMYPYLPRDEFRANLIGIEPLPGWETPKEPK
ncbi:MAG: thiamine pyrophosphate-binding protein [Candidatus Binatia bacterium]|nr:thiamine pyrophosphate-binding protein [Candidatus Binatia bacterium]